MFSCAPTDGSVLLSQAVDFHLDRNPSSVMYIYADDNSENTKKITYLEFARACHRIAYAMNPLGPDLEATQVVAIIAQCDTIVYQALLLGLHKAGLVPFPINPRNSPAAIVKLLKDTACHRIVSTKHTLDSLLASIQQELAKDSDGYALTIEEVPSLRYSFPKLAAESAEDPFTPYPEYTIRPSLTSIALYLHSSGSTGFPKAIPLTQRRILNWASLPPAADVLYYPTPILLSGMSLPSFHTLGIFTQLFFPIFAGKTVVVYPPTMNTETALPVMPTPDNVLDHARRTKCDGLIVVPTFLQFWVHSPEALDFLRTLRIVCYSGGAPPTKVGEALSEAGVVLRPMYGATEFSASTHWLPLEDDRNTEEWQWIRFGVKSRWNWIDQGDGTYELQVLRGETDHICVYNLPDESGYTTSDLFEKHPTKEGLWRMVGRKDDVIVHASGEKTVPAPLENSIASHPLIQGAVVFGERQSQPGVLIELSDNGLYPENDKQLEALRNKLWPAIEEANNVAPAFSRIYKDMILIVSPTKPLPRTGKGTVMRKAAIRTYTDEIQKLYDTIEAGVNSSSTVNPSSWTVEGLCSWLISQATDLMPNKSFSLTSDLFEQGFDSLTATLLRHRIVAALRSTSGHGSAAGVSQTLVYDHPTVERLAIEMGNLALGPISSSDDRRSRIESMITHSISHLEPLNKSNSSGVTNHIDHGAVVLLTGSTGGLGSYLLVTLLKHKSVARIYTLNRSASTPVDERQRVSFRDRGLDASLLESSKLISLEGDYAKPNFALQESIFDELRESATTIIHNAWRVDFNLALSAFEPLISGTLNLINLARCCPHSSSIRFIFTSSISAVQSWKSDHPVPEELIQDATVALGNGYGESKYVVERILGASGIQACSVRIGQISGGEPKGAWSVTDWVPIMIKSSVALKALPDSMGLVSWIPMDCVAQAILDTAFTAGPLPEVIHIVHPRPVPWTFVFRAFRDALYESSRGSIDLTLIPFKEWVETLHKRAENAKEVDIRQIPAVKLLAFFQHLATTEEETDGKSDRESGGFPSLQTEKAQSLSPALRDADMIRSMDVWRWVGYWISEGLFT